MNPTENTFHNNNNNKPDIPERATANSTTGVLVQNGLSTAQVQQALEQYGPNTVPTPKVRAYRVFCRQFTGFLPLLIAAAAFVSLAVQDITDFAIILSILFLNACFGFYEEMHAKRALDELSATLLSEIQVRRNGTTISLPVQELVPGDVVLLVNGTTIPADVVWLHGDTDLRLDTAPLTGETSPRKYPSQQYGKEMLSGMTVLSGECYAQVIRTGLQTEMGKAHAQVLKQKSIRVTSVFQQKVMRVVQFLLLYCLIVVIIVFVVQGVVYDGFKENMKETILDSLSILISAIPVALPLVIQINLALGAAYLANQHAAIVTSLPALQDIASMSMLCCDKTGTLTTAEMTVQQEYIHAVQPETFSADQVLKYALLCSNIDKQDDPIDRAICHAAQACQISTDGYTQTKIIGFNPNVKRVVAFCTTPDGQTITLAKGLPDKIIDTTRCNIDDHEIQWKVQGHDDKAFIDAFMAKDKALNEAGYKTIALAYYTGDARIPAEDQEWQLIGLLPLLDPPRADTHATIAALHHANISVQMITGDHVSVGRETARLIGLGTKNFWEGAHLRRQTDLNVKQDMIFQADGFCTVLPSDKQEIVMTLRHSCGLVTGMTGDGVNDVAALSAAHVGIAVQGATDAAKNAADLILTKAGLSPIYGAVVESRRIFARIKSYVVYRVAASIALVTSLAIILFVTGCACDSLLIIILALINDLSMIPVAYDNASATTNPELPHAGKLVVMSLYYGVVHTVLALLFIFSMLDLDELADLEDCDQTSRGFIWLYMILFSEFMIFSVRAPSLYCFSSRPSWWLVLSVAVACIFCSVLAVYRDGLNWDDVGYLWFWNASIFIAVDVGKICMLRCIGESVGETIDASEVAHLPTPSPKSEQVLQQEKESRLAVVQRLFTLSASDTTHNVQVMGREGAFTDGIVQNSKRMEIMTQSGIPVRKDGGAKNKKKKGDNKNTKNDGITFTTPSDIEMAW